MDVRLDCCLHRVKGNKTTIIIIHLNCTSDSNIMEKSNNYIDHFIEILSTNEVQGDRQVLICKSHSHLNPYTGNKMQDPTRLIYVHHVIMKVLIKLQTKGKIKFV